MLSGIEKQTLKADMADLLSSFGKSMTVFRSAVVNGGSFSGSNQTPEVRMGEANVEEKLLAPNALTDDGADRIVYCPGQTDIQEGDRVEMDDRSFLVSHVDPQNAFGVVTHLEVTLNRDKRHG